MHAGINRLISLNDLIFRSNSLHAVPASLILRPVLPAGNASGVVRKRGRIGASAPWPTKPRDRGGSVQGFPPGITTRSAGRARGRSGVRMKAAEAHREPEATRDSPGHLPAERAETKNAGRAAARSRCYLFRLASPKPPVFPDFPEARSETRRGDDELCPSAKGRKPKRASAGQAALAEGQPPAGGETARERREPAFNRFGLRSVPPNP